MIRQWDLRCAGGVQADVQHHPDPADVLQLHDTLTSKKSSKAVRLDSAKDRKARNGVSVLLQAHADGVAELVLGDRGSLTPELIATFHRPPLELSGLTEELRFDGERSRLKPRCSHRPTLEEHVLEARATCLKRTLLLRNRRKRRSDAHTPDMTTDPAVIIATYQPHTKSSAWEPISSLVRQLVQECAPRDVLEARRLLIFTSHYAMWFQSRGIEVTRESLADRRMLNYYIEQSRSQSDKSRRRTAAWHLSRPLFNEPPTVATVPVTPETPYTAAEIRQLRLWADGQNTARQIRNCNVLLALAAGAGLGLSELLTVRPGDVEHIDGVLCVHVRDAKTRTVPLLASWTERVERAMRDVAQDETLFASASQRGANYVMRDFLDNTGGTRIRPEPRRLRATWIATILSSGVSAASFMEVAGLTSATSLTKYLRFMPTTSLASFRDAQVSA